MAIFHLEIVDEHTLRVLETRYAGAQLRFDGGRVFTIEVQIHLPGLQERSPGFWKALREKAPEIVQRHILQRLKGDS